MERIFETEELLSDAQGNVYVVKDTVLYKSSDLGASWISNPTFFEDRKFHRRPVAMDSEGNIFRRHRTRCVYSK